MKVFFAQKLTSPDDATEIVADARSGSDVLRKLIDVEAEAVPEIWENMISIELPTGKVDVTYTTVVGRG
jgi:hypothetical protein